MPTIPFPVSKRRRILPNTRHPLLITYYFFVIEAGDLLLTGNIILRVFCAQRPLKALDIPCKFMWLA